MRIDVKKFLFVGVHEERHLFFKRCQELGIIHFIDNRTLKVKEVSSEVENVTKAIKVLRGLPKAEQEEMDDYSECDRITEKILQIKNAMEKLEEERRVLLLEIDRIRIFGEFSLDDLDYIEKEGHRKVQFFCAKSGYKEDHPIPEEMIYLDSDHGLEYFVAINIEPLQYHNMIEMRIEKPLSSLLQRNHEIDQDHHSLHETLKTYAKYNRFLHHALIYQLNSSHLNSTQNYVDFAIDEKLFTVEGWVPEDKLLHLDTLRKEFNMAIEEIAVEEIDSIPTYLENAGVNRVGEDLVHIYDTPSHTDNDPSLWVLFAFAFFFSIIVGDGGYGLIFLAVTIYIRYKVKKFTLAGKRLIKLMGMLSVFCIVWGLLTNSIFGISLSIDSPFRKVSLLQWLVEKKAEYHIYNHDETYSKWIEKFPDISSITDTQEFLTHAITDGKYVIINAFYDNIMLELALVIGIVHIILSMLRYARRTWANVGWIIFIIGSYLYIPIYLKAPSIMHFVFGVETITAEVNGLMMIAIGLISALGLAIIQNKLLGLTEVMNVIQVFADILSYLRLYALGLASAIVSSIVNDTAASTWLVFGIPLIIVGHAINILLAIVGGVIHGLRLNFIEWYHYSFEGGGKLFKPLKKLVVE